MWIRTAGIRQMRQTSQKIKTNWTQDVFQFPENVSTKINKTCRLIIELVFTPLNLVPYFNSRVILYWGSAGGRSGWTFLALTNYIEQGPSAPRVEANFFYHIQQSRIIRHTPVFLKYQTLKMETTYFSKTWITVYQTVQCQESRKHGCSDKIYH